MQVKIISKKPKNMAKKEKEVKVKTKHEDSKISELENNQKTILDLVSQLSDKIDKLTPKTQWQNPKATEVKDAEKPTDVTIPPKWRQIVDEVLGKDFGLSVEFPDSGKGFSFTIVVPREKSNASESHWDMHKSDLRTKQLLNSEGSEGVRKYCEMVKQNLIRKN